MLTCKSLITNGFLFRYILTFVTFVTFTFLYNKISKNYYLILLPVLFVILDESDNIFLYLYNQQECTKTFYYQISDKICDTLSYLVCLKLINNPELYFIIIYRIIGVLLFYITKNSYWLIVFFDFVKEYLLYLYFFNRLNRYLYFFIFLKICFEYYWHVIKNNNNYLHP